MQQPYTIISLGGSMISPEPGRIDTEFVSLFVSTIRSLATSDQRRFCISLGGGQTCRLYQNALRSVRTDVSDSELDWLGVYTCRYNAEFMRLAFADLAYESMVHSFDAKIQTDKPVVIIGAERPGGHSSDYDAVENALLYGAKHIINISNISYVYSSDPRTNPDATRYDALNWDQYLEIIPSGWKPGLSTPFDPVSAQVCRQNGITVSLVSGREADDMIACLKGEKYNGTTIG